MRLSFALRVARTQADNHDRLWNAYLSCWYVYLGSPWHSDMVWVRECQDDCINCRLEINNQLIYQHYYARGLWEREINVEI